MLLHPARGLEVAAAAAAVAAAAVLVAAVLVAAEVPERRCRQMPSAKSLKHAGACFSLVERKELESPILQTIIEFNVVYDHSRAHTFDDDSLTLET